MQLCALCIHPLQSYNITWFARPSYKIIFGISPYLTAIIADIGGVYTVQAEILMRKNMLPRSGVYLYIKLKSRLSVCPSRR